MIETLRDAYHRVFSCSIKRVTQHDAGGYVISDGVEWTEERTLCYYGGLMVWLVGTVAAVTIFEWNAGSPNRVTLAICAAGFFGGIGTALFANRFRKRAIIFSGDGGILTPHGFPGYPFRKKMNGVQGNIDSIGMRPNEYGSDQHNKFHFVVIYSKGGDIIRVTSDQLYYDFAYKVSMQLNNAFNSFR